LSWFLRVATLLYAKTTPIPRFAQEQALKVKPMLDRRLRRQKKESKDEFTEDKKDHCNWPTCPREERS